MKNIVSVDLFCGAGGLTRGLLDSGIQVAAGLDIESSCKYAYESNNGTTFHCKDVTSLKAKELSGMYPEGDIKLLAGCAPCQPFSTYSQGRDVKKDKKWPLLYAFSRLIKDTQPDLVTMENVPDVTKHKVYHDFVKTLKKQGYNIWADTVYCPDYGVPQTRSRHVLLASKLGSISLIPKTHNPDEYITVRQALSEQQLPKIKAGSASKLDRLHKAAGLSELNMKRMKASRPGGSWKDWPKHLIAECHRKPSGQTYSSVYSRMSWDEPAPTMTTQFFGFGNGRFGHPKENRAISLREGAIFQTFPDWYKFTEDTKPIQTSVVGKMIGNAVPPRLGQVIGESFKKHIEELKL
ncbi:DNA cytosine methyltransferase [Vibrio cholerae]|uniref:DNA cytosine methyltransferase n=1 Tax=Vibrio cholerae TaxID=666 RepID=UPI00227126CC|nr:DNA (cytosine-5-)-methyltransferase [Vibrio cholerae]EJB5292123.1 DNA (cytosine-5-)-methyltransferase [Vibrio cholerae]EKF9830759.1 DNA (cytosine-5-)-methyltransferase [Vibrio cholerae]EKF9972922.1 DNA (cytosine-5-)-methyltransferase [Vibrio cholerae]ELJ8487095.1 DNA (cytosine-5-)-methyltransferase [Vibrio cholerae]ELK0390001.1 DNA (cytosine-5-)-methyltransferase [Vibrio cholerae]